ncbi:hypothetical protein FB45DRAFT_869743 [Roridomyces roridus]|uniref:HD domain-containing protein n=1 Tax=Roridomyces roridus TaxID=1738132 RepID=A0AAD7BLW1_9AGAR|nr:hypothetical protein FB45DRAFT_869743 [Roridomyces roridus]
MAFPQTFDAYLPSNFQEFLALAKFKPEYISLEALHAVPLDPAHTASFEYAKKITPHEGFIHSVRCYYFSLAILANGFPSGTAGVPQITFTELVRRVYHTCILHDLGWTTTAEGRAHPAHTMSFELHGGIMAYEHLKAPELELDAHQLGDIVQSIMLHTSQWNEGTVSSTKQLISLSALLDVLGLQAFGPGVLGSMIHPKTIREIEKEYPRGKLGADARQALESNAKEAPDCLIGHFPGGLEAFVKVIRDEPIVPADE